LSDRRRIVRWRLNRWSGVRDLSRRYLDLLRLNGRWQIVLRLCRNDLIGLWLSGGNPVVLGLENRLGIELSFKGRRVGGLRREPVAVREAGRGTAGADDSHQKYHKQ
jgi:hypothetical protein